MGICYIFSTRGNALNNIYKSLSSEADYKVLRLIEEWRCGALCIPPGVKSQNLMTVPCIHTHTHTFFFSTVFWGPGSSNRMLTSRKAVTRQRWAITSQHRGGLLRESPHNIGCFYNATYCSYPNSSQCRAGINSMPWKKFFPIRDWTSPELPMKRKHHVLHRTNTGPRYRLC